MSFHLALRSGLAVALPVCLALASGPNDAAAAGAPAADDPGLSTGDLFRLRMVIGATIAPDGSAIACTIAVPRDPLSGKDGRSFVELHVIGRDGRSRPFITGEVNVADVDWMPDSRAITFLDKRGADKHRSLYAIPIDGGEARKLLEHEVDVAAYAVHPTLRRVAFLAKPEDKEAKARADKGFSQEVFEEDWRNSELFVAEIGVEGSKPRKVEVAGHPADLSWSGDGRNLLLSLAPDPLVDSSYVHKTLHVIDSETGAVAAKVQHQGKLGPSSIGPAGSKLAFVGSADEHDPQAGRLLIASASGGFTQELVPDYPGHFVKLAFADANTVVYLADRGCETVLGRVGIDGSGHEELLSESGFSVSSFSLTSDGKRAALVASTANDPPEVYVWDVAGAKRRLTHSNPWLAGRTLAAQEVFKFPARDGLEIEGILLRPLGVAAGVTPPAPAPLVMIVHGGPESHVRNGWVTRYSEPAQVLAAKGYAVYFPNYRASTGRGVAFSMLDHEDPAGKEFDDLVDAADALAAAGIADAAKVGVTGGSYGGYASGWCATKHTERFAAAVMGFGVSNLLSMCGTSDIPDEHFLVHHRMHPWDDWQLFLERSPIYHAPNSKTPILIMAGKVDTRVPPSQSTELYRYLKVSGHPAARLVLYAGEGHGNARAASRLDYCLRLQQWFDHYLMGPGGEPPDDVLDYEAMMKAGTVGAAAARPTATGS